MPLFSEHHDRGSLRLRDAPAVTADLISDIIGNTGRRLPSRIERLIESGARTDAALALLDLELPHWQLRRLTYDDGEWHCTLSRQREVPEWLDGESIDTHHADLPQAILSAVVAARHSTQSSRTSVPAVPRSAGELYQPICCDNFA